MVNFKINNNTTANDVIKYTLNAYDVPFTKSSTNQRDESTNNNLYCLVIVLGCRERVLKDNYCLFNLKDPWIHGRFYIRLVHDALAALKLDKKYTTLNNFNSNYRTTNNKNLVYSDIDANI